MMEFARLTFKDFVDDDIDDEIIDSNMTLLSSDDEDVVAKKGDEEDLAMVDGDAEEVSYESFDTLSDSSAPKGSCTDTESNRFSKSVVHEGYAFTKHSHAPATKYEPGAWATRFRCKGYRAPCSVWLTIKGKEVLSGLANEMIFRTGGDDRGNHTCSQGVGQDLVTLTGQKDATPEMKAKCIRLATEEPATPAKEISRCVMSEYRNTGNKTLTIAQMVSIVDYTRGKLFGGDWAIKISQPPLSHLVGDKADRWFLQFHNKANVSSTVKEEFIGWAHPNLLLEANCDNLRLNTDTTFKIVPRGFSQALVLMLWIARLGVYKAFYHVLMQGKSFRSFLLAIGYIVQSCCFRLRPMTITCDFESALISALLHHFELGGVSILGCVFHWKQALRKNLTKMRAFTPAEITALVGPNGHINILTQIPVGDILTQGLFTYRIFLLCPINLTHMHNDRYSLCPAC